MKTKLNILLIPFSTLLLTYLIFSFVRWDLDTSNYEIEIRGLMVFIWIVITGLMALFYFQPK